MVWEPSNKTPRISPQTLLNQLCRKAVWCGPFLGTWNRINLFSLKALLVLWLNHFFFINFIVPLVTQLFTVLVEFQKRSRLGEYWIYWFPNVTMFLSPSQFPWKLHKAVSPYRCVKLISPIEIESIFLFLIALNVYNMSIILPQEGWLQAVSVTFSFQNGDPDVFVPWQ